MDWISGIQRGIDYVETHITDKLDFTEVANQAYSSSFHFQRVFSILFGFTLGDYIRMRRLSLAGKELAYSNTKILDIAIKYGYDTQESFSRAFTRFHGVSPAQARKGANLKSFSRLSVKLILDGGSLMDYRIETMGNFKILCKKISIPPKEELTSAIVSRFWKECRTDGTISALSKYIPEKDVFHKCIVGVSFGKDGDNTNSPYAIGVQYNETPITEKDFQLEEIPAHTYAVFKCVGTMPEAFNKLYHQIYSEFFPTSSYQPRGGPDFEVYPSADVNNPKYTCEIWVALEKKYINSRRNPNE